MVPNANILLEFSQKLNVMNVLPDDLEKDEMIIEFRAPQKTISRLNKEFFRLTHKEDEECLDTNIIEVTSNGFHFRFVADQTKEEDDSE